MYQLAYTNTSIEKVIFLAKSFPSVKDNIVKLANNPYEASLKLNSSGLSEYYINVGRHCMLVNIDDKNNSVEICSIVHRSLLYRILKIAS